MVSREPWKMQWQHCRKPKMKQRNWCRSAWRHNPKLQNIEELQKGPCKRAGREYLCKREFKVQPKGSPLKKRMMGMWEYICQAQKETTLARGDIFFMAEPSLFFKLKLHCQLQAQWTIACAKKRWVLLVHGLQGAWVLKRGLRFVLARVCVCGFVFWNNWHLNLGLAVAVSLTHASFGSS